MEMILAAAVLGLLAMVFWLVRRLVNMGRELCNVVGYERDRYEARYQILFDRLASRDLPEAKKAETRKLELELRQERALAEIDASGKRSELFTPREERGVVVGLDLDADAKI
ncbi:MAG: hypothetical protein V1790_08785 [Planctomycetota bacterium]